MASNLDNGPNVQLVGLSKDTSYLSEACRTGERSSIGDELRASSVLELSEWERRSWTRPGLARWSGDDEKGKELKASAERSSASEFERRYERSQ